MEERLLEILRIALEYDVTDIHFTYSDGESAVTVEMRVHGQMHQLKPHADDLRLFRYLMYRSNLDVSSVLAPQTGSFEENVDGRMISLRFAVVSAWHQTNGVLRILDSRNQLTIDQLSDDPMTRSWLRDIGSFKNGLVIFSGPTGSGKTTTLYTILESIHGKKIFTLEDPVEVVHRSFVQLQVNDRQLTYADGIRQLMRHDPDIIMIGEIRDSEAAEMAVRTALTGHLVVTTLHSFSCTGAIDRMIDLGIKEYQLRDVLRGISSQRLMESEGERAGVYEIMDTGETEYYFEHRALRPGHITIEEKIRKAQEEGLVLK